MFLGGGERGGIPRPLPSAEGGCWVGSAPVTPGPRLRVGGSSGGGSPRWGLPFRVLVDVNPSDPKCVFCF